MVIQLVAAKPISAVTNEAKPNFTQKSNWINWKSECDFKLERSKVGFRVRVRLRLGLGLG